MIWVSLFIFVVFNFYLTFETQETYVKSKRVDFENARKKESVCEYDTVSLPHPGSKLCRLENGEATGYRKMEVDNMTAQVSPTPVFYVTACKSLCPEGVDKAGFCAAQGGGKDTVHDPRYQKCLETLDPGCKKSAKPVARDGNVLYYVKRFGNINCEN